MMMPANSEAADVLREQAMGLAHYRREKLIRFAHCDPAGIVFYPHYFLLINELVEDWFADELGVTFAELHLTRRLGVPTVHIECDFVKPCRLGELICLEVNVQKIGHSSITIDVHCRGEGQERLRATLTLVAMSLETARAVPIPDDIRARLDAVTSTNQTNRKEAR